MPDRRIGHWIPKRTGVDPDDPFDIGNAVCSVCGHDFQMWFTFDYFVEEHRYCPWCGAEMHEEGERK